MPHYYEMIGFDMSKCERNFRLHAKGAVYNPTAERELQKKLIEVRVLSKSGRDREATTTRNNYRFYGFFFIFFFVIYRLYRFELL